MGICFKNMAKCYVFVYSLYFLLLFYLFRIYFLYIRIIFPLFFRSFIYIFPISYDVMHCIFAETPGIFHISRMFSLFSPISTCSYVYIEQYRFLYSRNVLHFAISGARMSYRAVFPALAFLSKEAF